VRQVGWICAAAQGIEVKDRGQVPAEPGGQVQAATGKTLCGKALRFGLQYALMPMSGKFMPVYLCTCLYVAYRATIVNSAL
jgi:hypothetical protein